MGFICAAAIYNMYILPHIPYNDIHRFPTNPLQNCIISDITRTGHAHCVAGQLRHQGTEPIFYMQLAIIIASKAANEPRNRGDSGLGLNLKPKPYTVMTGGRDVGGHWSGEDVVHLKAVHLIFVHLDRLTCS